MTLQETALEEVRERLIKLERQNRRLKQIGAGALIVAASLFLMGQASQKKTVEANEFILRDDTGSVRARLGLYRDPTAAPTSLQEAQLLLFDQKGIKRVKLGDGAGPMPALVLFDTESKARAMLDEMDLVGGVLMLEDKQGNVRTRLREGDVFADDIAAVQAEANEFILKDDHGNTRASLFMTKGGTGKITLPGLDKPVSVNFNPGPRLSLYDEKGGVQAWFSEDGVVFDYKGRYSSFGPGILSVAGEGSSYAWLVPGALGVTDEQGFSATLGLTALETPSTGQTQKTSAASLVLFDKNKNVIWKAP